MANDKNCFGQVDLPQGLSPAFHEEPRCALSARVPVLKNLILPLFALILLFGCGEDTSQPVAGEPGQREDLNLAAVTQYYHENPDFFLLKEPADLPQDLAWQNGQQLPELGSAQARKGGTFYTSMPDFPRTLRWLGPDSNSHFRGFMLDDAGDGVVTPLLVELHTALEG